MKRLFLSALVAASPLFSEGSVALPVDAEAMDAMKRELENLHGFSISFDPSPTAATRKFSLSWEALSDEDADLRRAALFALRVELDRYPEGFVRRARVRQVGLVRNLKRQGYGMGGITLGGGNSGSWIFLEPSRVRTRAGTSSIPVSVLRGNLHHEFFHAVDDALWSSDEKAEWDALNVDERAGAGSLSILTNEDRVAGRNPLSIRWRRPGFINLYAQSSPKEDRAVTWEWLTHPEYRKLLDGVLAVDPVVVAKVDRMTNRMGRLDPALGVPSFYANLTNEESWRDLRALPVNGPSLSR